MKIILTSGYSNNPIYLFLLQLIPLSKVRCLNCTLYKSNNCNRIGECPQLGSNSQLSVNTPMHTVPTEPMLVDALH